MTTHTAAAPVVLLLTDCEGGTLAVRFANRAAAEAFEARHGVDGLGVPPLVSQAEAALRGALA